MEVSSTTFSSTLLGIKENIGIVAGEIGMNLLPAAKEIAGKIYDVTRNLIEWISTGDNFTRMVDTMTYVLAGVTAGLTAFLIVAKGAEIIHGLANAFKALTGAIAANPIGAIAVVVTAVLIPALIALYKNWDTVQTYLQQGIARLEYAFKWFGSVIKEGLTVAFNSAKIAAASMLDFIYGNVVRGVGKMLEVLGKLPFVGELFQNASKAVNGLGNAIGDMAERTKQQSKAAIQAAHDEQNASEQILKAKLAAIDSEAEARRAAIEAQKKENQEVVNSNIETNDAIVADTRETQEKIKSIKEKAVKDEIKTLLQRLNEIPHSEQQIQNQQIEQFKRFLAERMGLQFQQQQESLEAEQAYNEQKVSWLQAQLQTLREMQTLDGKERAALEQAVTDMILEIDKDALDKKEKLEKEANKGLSERLSKIPYTEQQIQNQQMEQFQQFLKQRMDLERVDTTNRITWLQEQHETLIKSESVMGEERLALDRAVNAMISEEDERALIERTQSVSDKLKKIPLSEKQIQQQQISQFKQFLEDRMNLEIKVGDNRVTWIQQQQNILLQLQSLTNEEQLALIKASNEMILEAKQDLNDSLIEKLNEVTVIQDELDAREKENIVKQNEAKLELLSDYYDERANLISEKESEHLDFYKTQLELIKENEQFSAEERTAIEEVLQQKISDIQQKMLEERANKIKQVLDISKSFVQGISSLFKIAGKEFKEFAIAEKAISLAEAVINTAVAVSKALASAPFPANLLPAAGAAAAGAAQVATITSTMIPSAETGGRFVVPNSSGVDSQLMKVNPGEEIDVTPRGMTGASGQQRFIFNIEKQTIFDIVNKGLSSGDIYEFSPAWNI
jgi:RNase H-fold protein (predicted Holliday junction resolvase)